jgi:ribonuclease I
MMQRSAAWGLLLLSLSTVMTGGMRLRATENEDDGVHSLTQQMNELTVTPGLAKLESEAKAKGILYKFDYQQEYQKPYESQSNEEKIRALTKLLEAQRKEEFGRYAVQVSKENCMDVATDISERIASLAKAAVPDTGALVLLAKKVLTCSFNEQFKQGDSTEDKMYQFLKGLVSQVKNDRITLNNLIVDDVFKRHNQDEVNKYNAMESNASSTLNKVKETLSQTKMMAQYLQKNQTRKDVENQVQYNLQSSPTAWSTALAQFQAQFDISGCKSGGDCYKLAIAVNWNLPCGHYNYNIHGLWYANEDAYRLPRNDNGPPLTDYTTEFLPLKIQNWAGKCPARPAGKRRAEQRCMRQGRKYKFTDPDNFEQWTLASYEWNKHGKKQPLDRQQYFDAAAMLLNRIQDSFVRGLAWHKDLRHSPAQQEYYCFKIVAGTWKYTPCL